VSATRHIISNYADFKAFVNGLGAANVLFNVQVNGNIFLWYMTKDGQYIISNVNQTGTAWNVIPIPGTFAADFPAAITLTAGVQGLIQLAD
jgi:hypothetical protein